MAVGAVFINLRYGWIVPNPDTRTLNSVALTHANLTLWQLWFWCCCSMVKVPIWAQRSVRVLQAVCLVQVALRTS